MSFELITIAKTDPELKKNMAVHYSQPKGFVGRSICYAVNFDGVLYGHIIGGSSTLHLPNRNEYFGIDKSKLNNIVNNIFFHVEKVNDKYPIRNFTSFILREFRKKNKCRLEREIRR